MYNIIFSSSKNVYVKVLVVSVLMTYPALLCFKNAFTKI